MANRIAYIGALFGVGALLLGSCSAAEPPVADRRVTPTPSPSKQEGLCQPFPDRLIDEFVANYNHRDLEALQALVVATDITDVVAAAYNGDARFENVAEWARVGWDAGDRMRLVGYGAFHPTKKGFQMILTRRSEVLRDAGIDRVSTTLDAISEDCTITSLAGSGPIQAMETPCAFYDSFDSVAEEPPPCIDGSADHARTGPGAVFTGDEMLVWGGHRGGQFTFADVATDGLAFDSNQGRWSRIPAAPMAPFAPEASAWTGTELIVLGGKTRPDYAVVGAAYNPNLREWRIIEPPPAGWARWGGFEGAWAGDRLVLWGGPYKSGNPSRRAVIYDSATDTWRKTAPAPVGGRYSHALVWTGAEVIVWGGSNANSDLADGAAYNPTTDTWRRLPSAPLSPRQWFPLLWTGREVIAWGGSSISRAVADGAAYDPATNSWRKLPPSPLRGRYYHSLVWTGTEAIVFGGYNYRHSFSDGAAYDPTTDTWRKLPPAPIKRRFDHAAVWTGREMVVFGGTWEDDHIALGDVGIYNPATNRWRRVVPEVRPE